MVLGLFDVAWGDLQHAGRKTVKGICPRGNNKVVIILFLEVSMDRDGSFRSWHLQLEVRVVRYCEKSCICRSAEYRVIL